MPSLNSSSKTKILFLHGFAQSGKIFEAKTSGFRKNLKKSIPNVEMVYVDGSIKLSKTDFHFDSISKLDSTRGGEQINYYGWWTTHDDSISESQFHSNTIAYLQRVFKEQGPFDGVIGFSQGAAMAAIVASSISLFDPSNVLKFAIVFSGFPLKFENLQRKYLGKRITIPTLHIFGELDTVILNEASELLVTQFCKSNTVTVYRHPGGHFVPNNKFIVNNWINWIKVTLKEQDSKRQAEEKGDPVDNLLDEIDNFF
ncbi:alpha/beta hydrolase [Ascoidea rubescens DSM 1968]|uniref:FSH1-domain-containing protein n=1 Tax=Ascoidea rubescens DSM 1968 TaxID=1344418 RepID=A0A1D2VK28_9ASCO|nr:FSH1-domain-containing protein [Ascoidea rubescens DSM 1968]ODV61981.1 FSH1-domain-containing protein [Ascoidea rubescens DSM 1968]